MRMMMTMGGERERERADCEHIKGGQGTGHNHTESVDCITLDDKFPVNQTVREREREAEGRRLVGLIVY